MFEKKKYKKEIKRCRATIEEIERKRSRSQSALVQAILLQEEPNEADVEWFNKYTGEITACRNHMTETQKKLDAYMASKQEKENKDKKVTAFSLLGKGASAVGNEVIDNTENEEKSQKWKIVIRIVCAAGALILLIIALISYGWFTMNKIVEINDMEMTAVNGKFELAAENTNGLYDNYLNASDGTELTDITVDGEATPTTLTATGDGKTEIKWLMSDESNFGNVIGDGIQPGSSGKVTFYVIAKQNTDLNLTFSLDTILYNNNAKEISAENPDNSEYIIDPDSSEAKLVKGHILFFENYNSTTGVYSDRITDKFTFIKDGAQENTAYKVDIYWIWPEVIDQLILPSGDGLFSEKGYDRIIGTAADDLIIKSDLTDYSDYFSDTEIENYSEMISNVSQGSNQTGFNSIFYNTLNAKWNEADQTIGTNVGYIELNLTADETVGG